MSRILAVLLIAVVAACADTPPDEGATLTPPAASLDPASPSTSGSPSTSAAELRLELLADALVAPVGLVSPGGDGDPSFVLDQTGPIRMLRDGQLLNHLWLDLTDRLARLDPEYDERGLLGLAFHPGFAQNGRLFVYYAYHTGAVSPRTHSAHSRAWSQTDFGDLGRIGG